MEQDQNLRHVKTHQIVLKLLLVEWLHEGSREKLTILRSHDEVGALIHPPLLSLTLKGFIVNQSLQVFIFLFHGHGGFSNIGVLASEFLHECPKIRGTGLHLHGARNISDFDLLFVPSTCPFVLHGPIGVSMCYY